MMQLRPQEVFTIVRGLEDHTDSATYYVRAVVRNARTDALIATVDLVDQGDGHRFTYNYTVPPDTSGEGFYISIVTSVYTDSGYTSKSANYGDSFDTFLIEQRLNGNSSHSGGSEVDYKKIQKMIEDAIKKIPAPEKVTIPSVDFAPLARQFEVLKKAIETIKLPENEKVDFTLVLAKLDEVSKTVKKSVEDIDIPEPDYGPVVSMVNEQKAMWDEAHQQINDVLERIKPFFTKDVDDIKELVSGLDKKLDGIAYVTLPPLKEKETEEV